MSEKEKDSKRQRISPGKNSPSATRDDAEDALTNGNGNPKERPTGAKRKGSVVDEKQRSKLIQDARSLGDRFGSGRSGGYL